MSRSVHEEAGGQRRSERDQRAYEFIDDPFEPGQSSFETGAAPADESSADPPAAPAPQFRDRLHRALEETHRQQAARRVLGAHQSAYQQRLDAQRRQRRLVALLAALAAVLVFTMIQQSKARCQ